MAIDMSTENTSLVVSPRISFSHDLCHTGSSHGGGGDDDDHAAETTTTTTEDKRCRRRDSSLLDLGNSDDFDFCSGNIEFQTSSAEELFSNGLIRTVQFQEKLVTSVSSKPRQPTNINKKTSSSSSLLPPLPTTTNGISISKQEIVSSNSDHQQNNSKIPSKSFWRIKRSSSLHCDNKKSSFWSLPLLSRSNSTGSVQPNNTNPPPKSSSTVKQQNGNSRHQQQMKNNNVSGISSSTFYVYPLSQKPPLRRNYLGHNNGMNGVRINPVLNVPSPHISKGTANLLGLGSFFRNGKDKKIVKK